MSVEKESEFEREIIQYWRDETFPGSYSGLTTFQACLELEKGIKLSRQRLLQILRKDPDFLSETRVTRRKIKRRPMTVYGYGILFQADLARCLQILYIILG